MEHKHFAIEELKTGDDSLTIEGLASFFGNVDNQNDIVLPGAFSKSIKKHKSFPMLWQHDTGDVIGTWTEAEETEKGLLVKGTIVDTTLGMDAYKLAKAGAVKGMSIGYNTKKYEIDKVKGTRKLMELDLIEVSLVTFPANEKANITRVKTAHGNEREFEEFLREAGYSRDAAKIITARGFKALGGQREADAVLLADIAKTLNQIR